MQDTKILAELQTLEMYWFQEKKKTVIINIQL